MGRYVNPGNEAFQRVVRTGKYVDKSGMIEFTNQIIHDFRPLICFSRPRRFGKSIAAHMLTAYYSKGCDSREIFSGLKIAGLPTYEDELNQNTIIYLDMQEFRSYASRQNVQQIVQHIQDVVVQELKVEYPDIVKDNENDIPHALSEINTQTGEQFIVIIDEWDCLFREDKENEAIQEMYVNFLRGMFKSASADAFIKLAYITGILPIKKYGTQSALNNFREYTMVSPGKLAEYVGFTEDEVKALCERYDMDFEECKRWYDGYSFSRMKSVYSPNSVMNAMDNGEFGSYWTRTETYESLRFYIDTDFDDVRKKILAMLSGEPVEINPRTFQNDMNSMKNSDDVLTLLIHLG